MQHKGGFYAQYKTFLHRLNKAYRYKLADTNSNMIV